jgi:uncharacterized membrane protein YdjX (TVP38/TMEM64 family)
VARAGDDLVLAAFAAPPPGSFCRSRLVSGAQADGKLAGHGPSPRIAVLILVLFAAALVAGSDELHGWILDVIARAEPVIADHPLTGIVLFVALAGLSAMLVFFSSVVLVPIGVAAWGEAGCFFLLWSGWFLGGVTTYVIGRTLGRRIVERLVKPEALARYEGHVPASRSFRTAFVVQLVLPSDVAGYLFGLLTYPAPAYLPALILAELPYAAGTVFLGAAFVRGQSRILLVFAVLALIGWVWSRRRRRARPAAA